MYFTKIQSRAKKYNEGHFWGFDRTTLIVNKEWWRTISKKIIKNTGESRAGASALKTKVISVAMTLYSQGNVRIHIPEKHIIQKII